MTAPQSEPARPVGPVVFAYDGTELAEFAITDAASHLSVDCDAVVVCVWQPADVGFTPINKSHFDADKAPAVLKAAEETAAYGATLAQKAGFRARGIAVESAPTWKGIVQAAEDVGASLIVVGSHRRAGFVGHLVGNVASAVVAHSHFSVLVVHQPH